MFECPALQGIKDTYNGLVGDYAAMIEFMWQHNTYAIMQFPQKVGTHIVNPALRIQAPDQP